MLVCLLVILYNGLHLRFYLLADFNELVQEVLGEFLDVILSVLDLGILHQLVDLIRSILESFVEVGLHLISLVLHIRRKVLVKISGGLSKLGLNLLEGVLDFAFMSGTLKND